MKSKLYKLALDLGFIIPVDNEQRIKYLVDKGFRVVEHKGKFVEVINILKPMSVNPFVERDIKYLYNWITTQ